MRVTVSNDGGFSICFEDIDKSSGTPYYKHSCDKLINIINKNDNNTTPPECKENKTDDTSPHACRELDKEYCELAGDSINGLIHFLDKIEKMNIGVKTAYDLSKQIILLKEIIQYHEDGMKENQIGGRGKRKLSKKILQKKRKSKKLLKTKTRYFQFGGYESESKESKSSEDCVDILLLLDNSLYGEIVNYMKRNNLISDSLCESSHKKISEVFSKYQSEITSIQSKIWSSLLEEKIVGDKPPKWIEYKLIYVGDELNKKINIYKEHLKGIVQMTKDEMDKCKKDILSSMINQALDKIPDTFSKTGDTKEEIRDILQSIKNLVDLSVSIYKLSNNKNAVDKLKMTESRINLGKKSNNIRDFLLSDNRKELLENVTFNLRNFPDTLKKLKEYQSPELSELRKTLTII